jgi:protein ImuA
MDGLKATLFQDLKKQVALLQQPQGIRTPAGQSLPPSILDHLPQRQLPQNVIHECLFNSPASYAAGNGFVFALAGSLNNYQKPVAFISSQNFPYPPALSSFNMNPSLLLFLHPLPGKQLLWTIEECLRSKALGLVIACCNQLDFTSSRRLQLAAEEGTTAFIFRDENKSQHQTASACRWKIKPLPGFQENEMPGLGSPCWDVSLLKARNGRPGRWTLHYRDQSLCLPAKEFKPLHLPWRKTGS